MAEYIVSLVIEKIATQLLEETLSLSRRSARGQVESIQGELRRMLCFLKDADEKQDGDERVRNWVAEIRDVAYETEDAIDSYIIETTRQQEKGKIVKSVILKRYPSCFNELIAGYKLKKNINKIKRRIDDISKSRSVYGIENIGKGGEGKTFADSSLHEKRRSYPQYFEEDTVGMEEDFWVLEDRIIHGELRLSVISIIGMAGLGKTTLAKKIFRSSDVNRHFDCCAWIYVSQECRGEEILRNLCRKLMGLSKIDLEYMPREEMGEKIYEFLEKRRYFIVFDDIWKQEVWADLQAVFPNTNNGSRIMLTTRFRDVALHADPRSAPHELCILSDEDSWKLLSKKICLEWNNTMTALPAWTEDLGRKIVKKCGGLPLAIVVLGGLLSRREASYAEWLKVLPSAHWQLMHDPTQCADILALSYRDLPDYLKPCFLYLGLFPEDFEISARRLIHLWFAEGFVQPRGQQLLEDVAEDYLEELVGRSMVQVAVKKSNGRIKTIRIHDLLREFSIRKAKEDRFLDVICTDINANLVMKPRRLSVNFDTPPTVVNLRVRSLLFFDFSSSIWRDLKKLKLLRVLDLENIYISALDSAVGDLIHLRYLGLRGTWLKQLPSSIANLFNLQTLDLRSTLVDPIPSFIWKMKELRHLYLDEIREMVVSPPENISLSNLQTLQGIYIGKTNRLVGGLEELTNLRHLALYGDLILQAEALRRWIFNSKGLQSLKLEASRNYEISEEINDNSVFTRLMPLSSNVLLYKMHLRGFMDKLFDVYDCPPNLTELSLHSSFLMEDPMGKLEKLPNLRVLKLKQSSYLGRQMVCSHGGFPQLQFLKLSFLIVETWKIENGAMPNLRQLQIVDCKRLKIVPRGLWPVTSLRHLKLGFMPHDLEVKVQERKGENWYRIEHVLPV